MNGKLGIWGGLAGHLARHPYLGGLGVLGERWIGQEKIPIFNIQHSIFNIQVKQDFTGREALWSVQE